MKQKQYFSIKYYNFSLICLYVSIKSGIHKHRGGFDETRTKGYNHGLCCFSIRLTFRHSASFIVRFFHPLASLSIANKDQFWLLFSNSLSSNWKNDAFANCHRKFDKVYHCCFHDAQYTLRSDHSTCLDVSYKKKDYRMIILYSS